jgi:hypothetical protein
MGIGLEKQEIYRKDGWLSILASSAMDAVLRH